MQKQIYKSNQDYIQDEFSYFKKGLSVQREYYKEANINNNFAAMVSCLENIKAEIKIQSINKGKEKDIKRVEKIIDWYKKIPIMFTNKTENGYITQIPPTYHIKISKYLNEAYEILINLMIILQLL